MRAFGLLAVMLAAAAPLRAAEDADFFAQAAREMARVSSKTHVRYVAVRSLTAANGGGSGAIGEGAALRLVAAMVHEGQPFVLHAAPKAEMPDAFVSGSYLSLGDRVQVTVTMVSALSGTPLYSAWKVVRNEWGDDGPRLGVGARRHEAAPSDPAVTIDADEDATPAGRHTCANWERRADALQRAVLLPKARYWAQRYWGASPEKTVGADPARLITSRDLAAEFNRSLRFWLSQRQVPKLTPEEVHAMINADLSTQEILEACGPGHTTVAHR